MATNGRHANQRGQGTTFLNLPVEIRQNIYQYVFDEVAISIRTFLVNVRPYHTDGTRVAGPTRRQTYRLLGLEGPSSRPYLLLTSKRIHNDAWDVFLQSVVVHYGIPTVRHVNRFPVADVIAFESDNRLRPRWKSVGDGTRGATHRHHKDDHSNGASYREDEDGQLGDREWLKHETRGSNIHLIPEDVERIRKVCDNIEISDTLGFRNELLRLFPRVNSLTIARKWNFAALSIEDIKADFQTRFTHDHDYHPFVSKDLKNADGETFYHDPHDMRLSGDQEDISYPINDIFLQMLNTTVQSLQQADRVWLSSLRKKVNEANRYDEDDVYTASSRTDRNSGGGLMVSQNDNDTKMTVKPDSKKRDCYRNGYLLLLNRSTRGFAVHIRSDKALKFFINLPLSSTSSSSSSETASAVDTIINPVSFGIIDPTTNEDVQFSSPDTNITNQFSPFAGLSSAANYMFHSNNVWSSWWDNLPRCEDHQQKHEQQRRQKAERRVGDSGGGGGSKVQPANSWWKRPFMKKEIRRERRIVVQVEFTYDFDTGRILESGFHTLVDHVRDVTTS